MYRAVFDQERLVHMLRQQRLQTKSVTLGIAALLAGGSTLAQTGPVSVQFTDGTGAITGHSVQNLSGAANAYSGMLFYDHTGALGQFQGFNNSTKEYRINNIATGGKINFMLNSQSKFEVLDGAGTVKINNPGTSPHPGGGSVVFPVDISHARFQDGVRIRATSDYGTLTLDGPLGGFLQLAQNGSTRWGIYTDSGNAYLTSYSGTGGFAIAQNTLIGSGTPSSLPDRLTVKGDARVGTSGTNGCVKNFAGTGIIGTCSSDARFKQAVSPFGPMLDKVASLRPVNYRWRASEFPKKGFGPGVQSGLIAQEVEKTLPELVSVDEDGYKTVNYTQLPLLAIQAIKELKADNDRLRATLTAQQRESAKQIAAIASQETAIETLKSRLESQEASLKKILAALEAPATLAQR